MEICSLGLFVSRSSQKPDGEYCDRDSAGGGGGAGPPAHQHHLAGKAGQVVKSAPKRNACVYDQL